MKELLEMLSVAKDEIVLTTKALFGTGKVIISTIIAVPTLGAILFANHLLSKHKH